MVTMFCLEQPEEPPIPASAWPRDCLDVLDVASGDEDSLMGLGSGANKSLGNTTNNTTFTVDPAERRNNAMLILHALLFEYTSMATHLGELLCAK